VEFESEDTPFGLPQDVNIEKINIRIESDNLCIEVIGPPELSESDCCLAGFLPTPHGVCKEKGMQ
jgi:hypothetical protein